MIKISLSRDELVIFASDNIGFYKLDINRISTIFLKQIHLIFISRLLNIYGIMDEVKHLEGFRPPSCTKSPEPFKHGLLKGYMKKHFTDARFLINNINDHFGINFGGNQKLNKIFPDAKNNKSGIIDNEFIGYMSHEMTFGAYEERANKKRLTGEWIVFKKHENKNYYLTLAAHTEDEKDIYNRIRMAIDMDFAFLDKINSALPSVSPL